MLTLTHSLPLPPQLPEEAELHWDCGDACPEPALDQVPKSIVGVREAAAMLLAGLGVYVAVYQTALAVDKPSTQPFADKTFPFDGLKKELGEMMMVPFERKAAVFLATRRGPARENASTRVRSYHTFVL